MYEIGDIVRVKTEEELSEEFECDRDIYLCDGLEFMPDMLKFCGLEMTVSHIGDDGFMHFEEDEENWWFNTSMVTPIYEHYGDLSDDIVESIMKFVKR